MLNEVGLLEFGGWDVTAVAVDPSVVEPVDPFGGGDLDVVGGPPRAAGLQFGLEQAVDRFSESVDAPISVKQRQGASRAWRVAAAWRPRVRVRGVV